MPEYMSNIRLSIKAGIIGNSNQIMFRLNAVVYHIWIISEILKIYLVT